MVPPYQNILWATCMFISLGKRISFTKQNWVLCFNSAWQYLGTHPKFFPLVSIILPANLKKPTFTNARPVVYLYFSLNGRMCNQSISDSMIIFVYICNWLHVYVYRRPPHCWPLTMSIEQKLSSKKESKSFIVNTTH